VAADEVRIAVEDSGPGFPAQPSSRTESQGTGLGLAIVRAVAAAHHGSVRIEQRPEGGTHAILTLRSHTDPSRS
jgi:signal transduction histidine kinase